jgi:hypothetical protein
LGKHDFDRSQNEESQLEKSFHFLEKANEYFKAGDLESALDDFYQALQDAACYYVEKAGVETGRAAPDESYDVKVVAAFMECADVPIKLRTRWSHLATWAAMSDGELTPDKIKKDFAVKIEDATALLSEIRALLEDFA